MNWTKAKESLPDHRQKVMFSPAGKSVSEATFFKTYVSAEIAEDLKDVFRINATGTLFHWHELPESDFQWMSMPDAPER